MIGILVKLENSVYFINSRSLFLSMSILYLPHINWLQEPLYLMRWTLDSVEFYRYVPKERPAAMSFNDVSGVIVDVMYLCS